LLSRIAIVPLTRATSTHSPPFEVLRDALRA
jgi:hypothetical protein